VLAIHVSNINTNALSTHNMEAKKIVDIEAKNESQR